LERISRQPSRIIIKKQLRQVGTILDIEETNEGMQLHFRTSGNSDDSMWVLSQKDIKYVDPYLK